MGAVSFHGRVRLAAVLVTLTLLALLFHTLLGVLDATYHVVRAVLGARQPCFNDPRTLTRAVVFARWELLLTSMMEQLALELPPNPS